MSRTTQVVTFRATDDPRYPYEALVEGRRWKLRLNARPDEPRYALLVDGKVVEELTAWPAAWTVPPATAQDAIERAEYEREVEQLERTRGVQPSTLVK